jgi:hypothetical protein
VPSRDGTRLRSAISAQNRRSALTGVCCHAGRWPVRNHRRGVKRLVSVTVWSRQNASPRSFHCAAPRGGYGHSGVRTGSAARARSRRAAAPVSPARSSPWRAGSKGCGSGLCRGCRGGNRPCSPGCSRRERQQGGAEPEESTALGSGLGAPLVEVEEATARPARPRPSPAGRRARLHCSDSSRNPVCGRAQDQPPARGECRGFRHGRRATRAGGRRVRDG